MSLSGALLFAISALNAQSSALAVIPTISPTHRRSATRANSASFESLVTGSSSASAYSVRRRDVALGQYPTRGLLTTASTSTNIAIQGNGFFPVATSLTGDSTLCAQRRVHYGFDGYLVNNGAYLLGWRTDAAGNVIGSASGKSHGNRHECGADQR